MTISELNAHLMGAYTDWMAFSLYVLTVLTIAVVIWGVASLFERGAGMNRALTYAMLAVGIALCLWGAALILRI